MKNIFGLTFGFIFSLFIEGFARLIVAFFHRIEFQFFGIDALPGNSWIFTIYFVSIIGTWLGAMMAFSISKWSLKLNSVFFGLFLLLWVILELSQNLGNSPTWHSISFPITTLIGFIVAIKTYKMNENAISTTH